MIPWLLTNAIGALILAIVAIGVIRWAKPTPVIRHALWVIVLIKLVSPFEWIWSIPVLTAPTVKSDESTMVRQVRISEAKVAPVAEAPGDAGEWVLARVMTEEEMFAAIDGRPAESLVSAEEEYSPVVNRSETTDDRQGTGAGESADVSPLQFVFGCWLLGACVMGLRTAWDTWRFARFVRGAKQASDSLAADTAVVANRLGIRPPRIRVLAGLHSPVMWCLGRPVLLWPAGLENQLVGEGRRGVIAHELAHVRRWDHWVRRLEMVAAILHWWNPLFWTARRRIREDAELACDSWATGQSDRRVYAEALLEICSFQPRRRPAPVVGVVGEGRRAMEERLTMIMRDRLPGRAAFGVKLTVALVAIASIPALTLGQSAADKAIAAEKTAMMEKAAAAERAAAAEKTLATHKAALEALRGLNNAGVEDALFLVNKAEPTKDKGGDEAKVIEAKIAELAKQLAELRAKKLLDTAKAAQQAAADAAKAAKAADEQKRIAIRIDGAKNFLGQAIANPPTSTGRTVTVIGADGKELKDVKVVVTEPGKAIKVLGADGRELKDVKVMIQEIRTENKTGVTGQSGTTNPHDMELRIVRVAPHGAGQAPAAAPAKIQVAAPTGGAQTLMRATFKLPKDQMAAVKGLLEAVKTGVMELKVDGDSLTVTTTPERMGAITGFVNMISGKSAASNFFMYTPTGQPSNLHSPSDFLFVPQHADAVKVNVVAPVAPVAPVPPAAVPARIGLFSPTDGKPIVIPLPTPPTPPAPPVKPVPAVKPIPAVKPAPATGSGPLSREVNVDVDISKIVTPLGKIEVNTIDPAQIIKEVRELELKGLDKELIKVIIQDVTKALSEKLEPAKTSGNKSGSPAPSNTPKIIEKVGENPASSKKPD